MLFNSISFIFLFFPIVTLSYFLLPYRYRHFFVLFASCWFYMAFAPIYILILAFLIVVDFWAGLVIEPAIGERRKVLLVLSLLANIGTLAIFKYFNFVNANLADLAHIIGWNYSISGLSLILPLGLSFHTFQSMSYTIDVYRKRQKAERDIWIYALYVMYYPQLVAGPIERPRNMLPQFQIEHHFDYDRFLSGMRLVLMGFFKKLVIANRLSGFVDIVYGKPEDSTELSLLLATYFFAFQIYCDFSGYTDIARGISRIMGIELMNNFDHPYCSRSVSEFWGRWHISLSSWFKEYLYVPLGGNRVAAWRWALNIMIVFLISGLWHGASWTFVVWGGLHGFYSLFGRFSEPFRSWFVHSIRLDRLPRIYAGIKILITFHIVTLAWIFFRTDTIQRGFYIIAHLFTGWHVSADYVMSSIFPFTRNVTSISHLLIAIILLSTLESAQWLQRNRSSRWALLILDRFSASTWAACLLIILFFGNYGSYTFIYFQF